MNNHDIEPVTLISVFCIPATTHKRESRVLTMQMI